MRLAVVGLGLIGGSLAWAARRSGAYQAVVGYDLAAGVAEGAVAMGAIDVAVASPAEAAGLADLVVVATPPLTVATVLLEAAAGARPGAVFTDVAGFKGGLSEAVVGRLPAGVAYVGGHPMAGSERSGLAAADPALFHGAVYAVTGRVGDPAAEAVAGLARNVGARPFYVDPAVHDRAVATISHLPYLLAVGLCLAAEAAGPAAAELAAGAFRDATRVAGGPPEVGRGMCLANAVEVARAWAELRTTVDGLVADLALGDDDRYERARAFRKGLGGPRRKGSDGR
ncbi:MAG: prephenate dehydrogenase [Bacillota bacterium]